MTSRFEGTGALSAETARRIGLVGPAARACGIGRDVRHDFPSGWLSVRPHSRLHGGRRGDVFARAWVRWLEIQRSIAFVDEQLRRPARGADPRGGPHRAARAARPRRDPGRGLAGRDLPRRRHRPDGTVRALRRGRSLVPQLARPGPGDARAARSPTSRSATRASTSRTAGTTCRGRRRC